MQLERSVHSHRGSTVHVPDKNLTHKSTKRRDTLLQETQPLYKGKQYEDEHNAYNFKTTIHSHPTLVRLSFIFVLLVVSYQLFSLASDPVKPQIPVISHVISVLFACIFWSGIHRDIDTHICSVWYYRAMSDLWHLLRWTPDVLHAWLSKALPIIHFTPSLLCFRTKLLQCNW